MLLAACALAASPFAVMWLLQDYFTTNDDNILVNLLALAVGIACVAALIAGVVAVGAAVVNFLAALFGQR